MMTTINNKLANAQENTWLVDSLTDEDRQAAQFIALIAVSIQQQRKALGITQKELADRLGVSQAMVSAWENGDKNFTISTLTRIAYALGLSLCNPISV